MATSKACGSSEIHHDLNVGNQLNPGDIFPRFSPTGGRYRMRGAAGFESAVLGIKRPAAPDRYADNWALNHSISMKYGGE